MPQFRTLFPTRLYAAKLAPALTGQVEDAALALADQDQAGRRWSREHGYRGYTSYASLNDLPLRDPAFGALAKSLNRHVAAFARDAEFDAGRRKLVLDSLWVNVMRQGAVHAPHIHPHAVISGTFYAAVPPGSGAIKFEDPRLAMLMAAPPKKQKARNPSFVAVAPKPGLLLLWESWLRHGVEASAAKAPRISVSFNFRLD